MMERGSSYGGGTVTLWCRG